MSGGSYEYLCHKDIEDLFPWGGELEAMTSRLAGLGAADAAKETYSLLLQIRAFQVRSEAIIERLRDVWKAVEWVDSCDWGPESIPEALAKYRGESHV